MRTSGLTRRRFLVGMGVAGGAGAVWTAMETLGLAEPARSARLRYRAPTAADFSLQGRANGTSVVVVGAGPAGLCTAYELEKAGYAVTVLEARDRPGGRVWTARAGTTGVDGAGEQSCDFAEGEYMNVGAARIPQHHTTLDYCRELGIPVEVFANANAQAWLWADPGGGASGAWAGRAVRRRTVRADTYGYIAELLAKAVDQGALDRELTGADREALVELLRSVGALDASGRYAGGASAGGAGGYPADDEPGAGTRLGTAVDPVALSDVLASGLGHDLAFEHGWDQAMVMFQPVGGMDRIPAALEAALRTPPTYGAVVTEIAGGGDSVTVTYRRDGRDDTVTADYCVCTVPPHVLASIPNDFGTQVNADLAVPIPVPTGKIGLQYGRRWWEEDEQLYGGITATDLDIGGIWYPSHGHLGERGVLVGYYPFGEQAVALGALAPGERLARAVEAGTLVHGEGYADVEASFSHDWTTSPHSEGGWVAWPEGTQGGPSTPYGRLLAPAGRTYFAGDHLTHTIAWQHGALESARLTVTNLHTRALAT